MPTRRRFLVPPFFLTCLEFFVVLMTETDCNQVIVGLLNWYKFNLFFVLFINMTTRLQKMAYDLLHFFVHSIFVVVWTMRIGFMRLSRCKLLSRNYVVHPIGTRVYRICQKGSDIFGQVLGFSEREVFSFSLSVQG